MKHLTWWCLRHDRLPKNKRLRRAMLRSIFKPIASRDLGSGIDGWYDLGPDVSPEQAERFRYWAWNAEDGDVSR